MLRNCVTSEKDWAQEVFDEHFHVICAKQWYILVHVIIKRIYKSIKDVRIEQTVEYMAVFPISSS